ncbi:MAG TPA: fumarylacetoacetate hydrolase family protein [Ginsengibacter sp.]|nr:fumarylacetoacetate hydrolase family protein [Ginsengibacter sp.]HRP44285.1 fumarylacetoacetate hydrolase family protein [Ginsengibacter sp.]
MKIFCIGRNYVDHAKELGNEVPEEPVVFMKPKSALLQAHSPFYYPEFTNELHYECEFVIRISKNGKYVQPKHASNYYNAYSIGIDFTARDIQSQLKEKGLPWERAKAFDNSAVIGNLTDIKNGEDIRKLSFFLKKNGEIVQRATVGDMIFQVDEIVSHLSNYFSLNIGDFIFTGTPAGVGECVVGDKLEGFLENQKVLEVEIK